MYYAKMINNPKATTLIGVLLYRFIWDDLNSAFIEHFPVWDRN